MNTFSKYDFFSLVRYSLCVVAVLIFHGCEKETVVSTEYRIEPDFSSYMEAFIEEAKNRGIEIKKENLIIEFGVTSFEICGECINPTGKGQRRVVINNCWHDALTQNREALIFHELGHCLLNRHHKDDLLPNGDVASIMNSENDEPYGPCVYVIDGDLSCDKTARREYYINELFDPTTDVPDWGE